MTKEQREKILADMRKTADEVSRWPLWRQGVLGTPQWMIDEYNKRKLAKPEEKP